MRRRRSTGRSRLVLHLENASGYDYRDLASFIEAGLRAVGVTGPVRCVVSASPIRSRGCATVGGREISLAIAPPSKFTYRRLARLVEHEGAHLRGVEHEEMDEALLYSEGPLPRWAVGLRIRYRGRAPDQMAVLRRHQRRSSLRPGERDERPGRVCACPH